jgi:hypothetical protein
MGGGRRREEQTAGHGTFVPLVFRPVEAFQFDWSEEITRLLVASAPSCSWPI